jgi:hypothetical protein
MIDRELRKDLQEKKSVAGLFSQGSRLVRKRAPNLRVTDTASNV